MRGHATSSEVFTEVKHLDSIQFVSHLQFGAYSFDIVVDLVFTLVAELRTRRSQDREFRSHGALPPWEGGAYSLPR